MISPGAVIQSVLPVYLIILAGAVLRKIGVLDRLHDEGGMKVVYSVLLPCLILDKILGYEVLRSGATVAWGMGLGFALSLSGVAIGWLAGRVLGLDRGTGLRTFALAAGFQNFGFTAIPVVEILWGGGALAVLFVHNIGVEVAIWTVGVMMMSGGTFSWKKLVNGPVISVLIGMILVAFRVDDQIQGPAREALSMLGRCAFPLAILITGASMIDLAMTERPTVKMAVGSIAVRLFLSPAVFLVAAKYLPLATELKKVLVVQAAMPAAMSTVLLARLYGGRPAIAVQVIIVTTIASFATLPWIITWATQWIGLKP